jgi:hypothetical protein
LALGRELVRNLELDARGSTLERWLAHHLAELMIEAERANGPAKAEAEARAADLILRLWAKRRDLPVAADPLGGYREAIETLSRLIPDRNPWAAYAGRGGSEQVLHDLFDCMARIVVGGLLLTMASEPRQMAPAEQAAMERDELALREHLEWWERAIRPDPHLIVRHFVGPGDEVDDPNDGLAAEAERSAMAAPNEAEDQGGEQEEDGGDEHCDDAELERRAREVVTTCLERFQQDLASLVDRFSTPA